jgi:hypothetical protein
MHRYDLARHEYHREVPRPAGDDAYDRSVSRSVLSA